MLLGNVERPFTSPGILELLTRAIAGTETRSRVGRGTIADPEQVDGLQRNADAMVNDFQ